MGTQVANHHILQLIRQITFVVDVGANYLVAMLCYVSD